MSVPATIVADRPLRQVTIHSVRNTVFPGETDAQRRQRGEALLRAQEALAAGKATEAALEKEIGEQANLPPLTPAQLDTHVISIVGNSFPTSFSVC